MKGGIVLLAIAVAVAGLFAVYADTGANAVGNAPAWPFAHGSVANTRTAETAVNPASIQQARVAWSYAAAGAVTGTPVYWEGVVYFADWGGKVHAVNAGTGALVWRADNTNGVDSSLAVDAKRVYVADDEGYLSARDRATGELVWTTRVENVDGTHLYGSPVLHENLIYLGIASDQSRIEFKGDLTFRGSVACFDAKTGKLVWKTYFQPAGALGVSVWSTPALDPELGLLFVGTGNAYGPPAGNMSDAIVALRMSDGKIMWSMQATKGDTFDARGSPGPDKDFGSSPVLFETGDGRKLVGDGDKGGYFYALDRKTGEQVWKIRVDYKHPDAREGENEGFIGTTAVRNGTLYAPTTARSIVHAINASTGKIEWAQELNEMPTQYGLRMFGHTTAADGLVLQGNAFGKVFALDARTGKILKELPAGGVVQGGISLAGDRFFVPHAGPSLWGTAGGVTAFTVPADQKWTPSQDPTPQTPTVTPPPTPTKDDSAAQPSTPTRSADPPPSRIVPGPGAAGALAGAALALAGLSAGGGRRAR